MINRNYHRIDFVHQNVKLLTTTKNKKGTSHEI